MNRLPLLMPLLAAALFAHAPALLAKKSDRDQPIQIDADRIVVDQRERVHRFSGNVRLQQGTIEIRADEVTVVQDDQGFRTGTAVGKGRLATFRQQKEGSNEWITGEAERLDYNARAEVLTLTGRARVTSGADLVEGAIIRYEVSNETYHVTHTGATSSAPGGRVRAIIQPKTQPPGGKSHE